jgi:hypothetical protein
MAEVSIEYAVRICIKDTRTDSVVEATEMQKVLIMVLMLLLV